MKHGENNSVWLREGGRDVGGSLRQFLYSLQTKVTSSTPTDWHTEYTERPRRHHHAVPSSTMEQQQSVKLNKTGNQYEQNAGAVFTANKKHTVPVAYWSIFTYSKWFPPNDELKQSTLPQTAENAVWNEDEEGVGGIYTRDRMKPLNVAAQFQKQPCCVHRNFFFVKKACNYSHGFCRILTVHLAVHSQYVLCNQYCGRRDSHKGGSEASRMQPSCTLFLGITNPTVMIHFLYILLFLIWHMYLYVIHC